MFVKNRIIALTVLISFLTVFTINLPAYAESAPLSSVEDFVVYYGDVTTSNIPKISVYDLAVLEPTAVSAGEMSQLKSASTLLFGYYSVHEVERYDTQKISLMYDSDYLSVNGTKVYNSEYNCYNGDIRSTHFQDISLQIIKERIVDKGYNGVFLDTLDDIEAITDPVLKEALLVAYLTFLERINQTFPGLLIIQNRSFNLYLRGSSKSVDAIVYEGFNHLKFETSQYYRNLASQLSNVAQRDMDVVMAISHDDAQANYDLCKTYKWLFNYCPTSNNYLQLESTRYSISLNETAPLETIPLETTTTQPSSETLVPTLPQIDPSAETTAPTPVVITPPTTEATTLTTTVTSSTTTTAETTSAATTTVTKPSRRPKRR